MSAAAPGAAGGAGALALDRAAIRAILDGARFRERGVLLETEGMALLDALGIATPRRVEFADADGAARLPEAPLPGGAERVVLKVVAPDLLHKTEAGGVRALPNRRDAVAAAARDMEQRLAGHAVAGFVLYEFVPHDPALGHEFLLGMRWTRDFGPVVTVGPGGIHAEFLARAFRDGEGLAVGSPALAGGDAVERALGRVAAARLAIEPQRGRAPELPAAVLAAAARRFLALAEAFCPDPIAEFEVNPLVASGGRLVALDALLKFSELGGAADAGAGASAPPRPLNKIRTLLKPRTIAVVGVSEKLNPGRIILQNILREGFPLEHVFVVKPGAETIDGARCVPSLADLPEKVDMVVLSVSAAQSAELLTEIAEQRRAETVVLIPGGLEEKAGTESVVGRMRAALTASRAAEWGGPVVNGGNCLGIRSVPGRYNTLFIPEAKLPVPRGVPHPLALITGSGAFAICRASKLAGVNPRYTITVGNQMDLTVGDYLHYLKDDPGIETFAVYVEGFRPLDGTRFLAAAREITAGGRTVVLYRAGRTSAGAAAAASHTASVAGDYLVTRQLAEGAGCVVADSLEDFEDLVRLLTFLSGRDIGARDAGGVDSGARDAAGPALGAISNAGFECVAMADNLGPFRLATFGDATVARLGEILARARLGEIVGIHNPIDLTPMLGDADFEAVTRAILEDPGVDAAVVGVVPMTGALNTLAAGAGHNEDVRREDSVVARLLRLREEIAKPWVAVVDAGRIYDPMAQALEDGGVAAFRTADRALRLLGLWHRARRGAR